MDCRPIPPPTRDLRSRAPAGAERLRIKCESFLLCKPLLIARPARRGADGWLALIGEPDKRLRRAPIPTFPRGREKEPKACGECSLPRLRGERKARLHGTAVRACRAPGALRLAG